MLPPGAPPLDFGPALCELAGDLRWLAGPTDPAALRARVGALGGAACLYRRAGAMDGVSTFQPLAPAVLEIHRRLKRAFDPHAVFDAHRLEPGL
jgi:glycolate oxidase FAD binding subunit